MGTESCHCGHDDQAGGKVTGKSTPPIVGLMLGIDFGRFLFKAPLQ